MAIKNMDEVIFAVARVYALNPATVSSDPKLILEFWETYDNKGLPMAPDGRRRLPVWFRRWFLNEATPPDFITRAGRKNREKQKYKARGEVEEARTEKANQMRLYFGGK